MKSILIAVLGLFFLQNSIAQTPMKISTSAALSDIEKLVTTFEAVHYNPYFKTSKEAFDSTKNKLLSEWISDSITLKEFMVKGMKLTAILSGGHSQMDWQNPGIIPEMKAHTYLPFTGKIDTKNRFIVTKSTIEEIQEGTEIQAINNVPIAKLYQECMSYIGGIEAFKNATCEKLFPLYLFFNNTIKPPYTIQISNSDKDLKTNGIDLGVLINFINASQKQPDYTFEIIDRKVGLISYNACNDYDQFDLFLTQTFKTIAENQIDKLIIDIRQNGGGNSELNDLLLSYITTTPYRQSSGRYWKVSELSKQVYASNPIYAEVFGEKFINEYMLKSNQSVIFDTAETGLITPQNKSNSFTGKTCMLIGPNTFSSANFLADAVKTYHLTTLIGKSTGEYTNDFGEQMQFQLPNSKSYVFISSTYDIGANGDETVLEPVYPDIETDTDALKFALEWINK